MYLNAGKNRVQKPYESQTIHFWAAFIFRCISTLTMNTNLHQEHFPFSRQGHDFLRLPRIEAQSFLTEHMFPMRNCQLNVLIMLRVDGSDVNYICSMKHNWQNSRLMGI